MVLPAMSFSMHLQHSKLGDFFFYMHLQFWSFSELITHLFFVVGGGGVDLL